MRMFIILGAVLLIKQALGEAENISTSNEWSTTGKAFSDAVIEKLVTISEEPINLSKKLLEDAYADKSNSENATKAIAEILIAFESNNQKKPTNGIVASLELAFLFDIFSSRIIIANDCEKCKDILLLKAVLQKHDVKSVANEFQLKFDEFFEWLTQEFEAMRDKLTTEEQLSVKAFKDLFQQFKDETNYEKRKRSYRTIAYRVGK